MNWIPAAARMTNFVCFEHVYSETPIWARVPWQKRLETRSNAGVSNSRRYFSISRSPCQNQKRHVPDGNRGRNWLVLYNKGLSQLIGIIPRKAIQVNSTKPAKPAAKAKTPRKTAAAKSVVAEVEAPVAVKQAHGTSRPVMSLPPPTGQPPKAPGKAARVPDVAAPRYGSLVKRDVVKAE